MHHWNLILLYSIHFVMWRSFKCIWLKNKVRWVFYDVFELQKIFGDKKKLLSFVYSRRSARIGETICLINLIIITLDDAEIL